VGVIVIYALIGATVLSLCIAASKYRETQELRRLNQRLRQAEIDQRTKYEILTDNVAAAVILHDPHGAVVWCSPFTEVLTGFAISEILENKESFFTTQIHEEDRDLFQRALKIISTGEPFQWRCRFFHKSGLMMWYETRTVPIYDEGLEDYMALSITIDVTANVINQMQIEERNRDLHEFTYMISHDLKAPIFTIKGMMAIVHEDLQGEMQPSVTDALQYIDRAAIRLEHLVGGILELAQVSTLSSKSNEPLPILEVFDEIRADYQPKLAEVGGILEVAAPFPEALLDRTAAYQIFSNLIGNAIKYRNPDRPLTIAVKARPTRAPRRIQIEVRDNGRGIPADKLPLLFKAFQRLGEDQTEGTGVGLACVKRLVEKAGGTIHAESNDGPGTCFVVELRIPSASSVNLHLKAQTAARKEPSPAQNQET